MSKTPFEMELLVPRRLNMDEEDEDVSVVTEVGGFTGENTENVLVPASRSRTEGKSMLELRRSVAFMNFQLDPEHLNDAIDFICMWTPKRSKGKVSNSDLKVLALPLLDRCPLPNKKKMCRCLEMSHLASSDFQRDIRLAYVKLCKEGSHEMGNMFLMSMMVPKSHSQVSYYTEWTGNHHLQFIVPGFGCEQECRRFKLCSKQFQKLFGLTQPRLSRLMSLRRKEWPTICDNPWYMNPSEWMGWSKNLDEYMFGETIYTVFGTRKYMEFCCIHGKTTEI